MAGRFVLVTAVAVFGLCCVPYSSGASVTYTANTANTSRTAERYLTESNIRRLIDDLEMIVTENSGLDFNSSKGAINKEFTEFLMKHFTGVVNNTIKFDFNKTTKLIFNNANGMDLLAGLNVCTHIKNYKTKNVVTEYELRAHNISFFCIRNWELKCYCIEKDKVSIKTEIIENNFEILRECCKGYEKTPSQTQCHPICNDPCVGGTCVLPNICRCDEYHDGPTCRIRIGCPPGTFGLDCTQTCQCQNNASCNFKNGSCSCQPGYWGHHCEDPCPSGYYGQECKNQCQCQFGAQCNSSNGTCHCLPGYTGVNCEVQCAPGYYGDKCKSVCKYKNGTKCDIINGECSCSLKHEEYDAEVNKCDCQTGTLCNSPNETCSCQPGDAGNNCEFTCPPGYYGNTCENPCKCNKDEICNAVNGDCYCSPGYTGDNCTSTCPLGLYGHRCQNQCKCQNGALCDPVNGVCSCKDGWTGNECNTLCPSGVNCNSDCTYCQNGAKCRATDGSCECTPGFFGPTCSEASDENIRALQLTPSNNDAVWIFDILVVLSFLIISITCLATMMCYFYYCHRCNGHVNHLELQKSTNIDPNSNIQVICNSSNCNMNRGNVMPELRKPKTSYTNEIFYENFSPGRCFDDVTGENLYLEIDESTFERAEDLYDHLDFLRPTAPWKPHYQSALVFHEQGSNSLKKGNA